MKSLCIVFLTFFSVFSFTEALAVNTRSTNVINRLKRDAQLNLNAITSENGGRKFDPRDSFVSMCQQHCLSGMVNTYTSLGVGGQVSGVLDSRLLNKTYYEMFCNVSSVVKSCLHACGLLWPAASDTLLEQGLMKQNRLGDFICVDHRQAFLDSLSCYQQIDAELQQQCPLQCGHYSDVITAQSHIVDTTNDASFTQFMDKSCKFLACQLACETPILIRYCDGNPKPIQLLKDFIALSVKSIQELAELAPNLIVFPESCLRISSEGY